jgi:Rrf2 family protein
MRISTKSQYGLRAMAYLASVFKKDEVHPLREIAEKEGISFSYLEKILLKLEKAGLVKTKRGARGGYSLGKSPKKIKVGEIIRALEENTSLVKCVVSGGRSSCPRESKCLAKSFWKKIQRSIDSTLDSITLADLIKK